MLFSNFKDYVSLHAHTHTTHICTMFKLLLHFFFRLRMILNFDLVYWRELEYHSESVCLLLIAQHFFLILYLMKRLSASSMLSTFPSNNVPGQTSTSHILIIIIAHFRLSNFSLYQNAQQSPAFGCGRCRSLIITKTGHTFSFNYSHIVWIA